MLLRSQTTFWYAFIHALGAASISISAFVGGGHVSYEL
jgi:hypothetical protein